MIQIKDSNKGKFTKQADNANMGVQEFASHVLANKDDYDAATVRRANFARNAKSWVHKGQEGMIVGYEVVPEERTAWIPTVDDMVSKPVKWYVNGNLYEPDYKILKPHYYFKPSGRSFGKEDKHNYFENKYGYLSKRIGDDSEVTLYFTPKVQYRIKPEYKVYKDYELNPDKALIEPKVMEVQELFFDKGTTYAPNAISKGDRYYNGYNPNDVFGYRKGGLIKRRSI